MTDITTAAQQQQQQQQKRTWYAKNRVRLREKHKRNRKDPGWRARQAELLEKKRASGNKRRGDIWSPSRIHALLSLEE